MMPHEPVRDVMRRTMHNLKFVKDRASATGPYEVTQLLNSFLGALAHPWEKYRPDLMAISLIAAQADGWPNIRKELPTDIDPSSLGKLVGLMRNAIAHGNIEFVPDDKGQICKLRLWNIPPGKQRNWGTVITVDDMETFLMCFVKLAEALDKKSKSTP